MLQEASERHAEEVALKRKLKKSVALTKDARSKVDAEQLSVLQKEAIERLTAETTEKQSFFERQNEDLLKKVKRGPTLEAERQASASVI